MAIQSRSPEEHGSADAREGLLSEHVKGAAIAQVSDQDVLSLGGTGNRADCPLPQDKAIGTPMARTSLGITDGDRGDNRSSFMDGATMFGKDADDRWDDTIDYLNVHFPCGGLDDRLGDHIELVVPQAQRKAISKELSFGSRGDSKTDPGYAAKTDQRRALRALLLCQRVYFSNLWAKKTVNGIPGSSPDLLGPNWRADSTAHWQNQTEVEIRAGIGMFAPIPGAVSADVATAAEAGAPDGLGIEIAGNLKLSRNLNCCIGAAETCYRGVCAWLLQSGMVSLRWFLRDCSPNAKAACDLMFGTGVTVWDSATLFEDTSVLPEIGRGFIVHMWNEQTGVGGWNGHWVISKGGGRICGVNNGIVNKHDEVVITAYTNGGKLRSQFEGYGGYFKVQKQEVGETGSTWVTMMRDGKPVPSKGKLVKFDPMLLADRM